MKIRIELADGSLGAVNIDSAPGRLPIDLDNSKDNEQSIKARQDHLAALRSPLAVIYGLTKLLQDGSINENGRAKALAAIHRGAKEQIRILDIMNSASEN